MAASATKFSVNETGHRFEWNLNGKVGFIDYKKIGNRITLLHTEIPPEFRNRGEGTAFVEETLRYIKENHFNIIVLCTFVQAYLKKHPEWTDLIDPHFRIKGFNDEK